MPGNGFPSEFPIFPLPNVVLFPETRLPLLIFEPRYRAMMASALAGEKVIGMALLSDAARAPEACAPIYPTGCAGIILDSIQLPDGRYQLLLQGERRFRVKNEYPRDGGYRFAETELLPDPTLEALSSEERTELLGMRGAFEEAAVELAQAGSPGTLQKLKQHLATLHPLALLHLLCFALDSEILERQSLLEALDPVERGRLLLRLLEFRRAAERLPDSTQLRN